MRTSPLRLVALAALAALFAAVAIGRSEAAGTGAQQPPPQTIWLTVLAATGVAATDTANLQSALNAVPANGATVYVPGGTYSINNTLLVKSNTRLSFAPGATLATAATWLGNVPAPTGASLPFLQYVIANVNQAAVSITDHDIIIENPTIDSTANANGSGIWMRMAQRVQVIRATCINTGDCTAFLASDDTLTADFNVTGAKNACADHWEGATNLKVRGGKCQSALYGVLVTGTNTAGSNQVSVGGLIEGGDYTINGSGGACIWLNGIGTAGSGVSKVRIVAPNCVMSNGAVAGIKISGGGKDVEVLAPIITGTLTNPAILTSADSGGTPTNTQILGGVLDGLNVGSNPLISLAGTNDRVSDVMGTAGTYTYAISLAGTNQFASHNTIPAGSSGVYSLTGTTPTVVEPDLAIAWTPTFNFAGAHVGMTYTTQSGKYFLNGKMVKACGTLNLSAKGSSTGAATIDALPLAASATVASDYPTMNLSYAGISTGGGALATVFANGTSIFLYSAGNGAAALTDANFVNATNLRFCLDYPIN